MFQDATISVPLADEEHSWGLAGKIYLKKNVQKDGSMNEIFEHFLLLFLKFFRI